MPNFWATCTIFCISAYGVSTAGGSAIAGAGTLHSRKYPSAPARVSSTRIRACSATIVRATEFRAFRTGQTGAGDLLLIAGMQFVPKRSFKPLTPRGMTHAGAGPAILPSAAVPIGQAQHSGPALTILVPSRGHPDLCRGSAEFSQPCHPLRAIFGFVNLKRGESCRYTPRPLGRRGSVELN